MKRRRLLTLTLTVVLVVAALGMIAGAWDRTHPAMYRLALGVAIFAGTALTLLRTGVSERALERARQRGYDDGYSDGCDVTRPSRLVRLQPTGSDGAAFPLGRPT